MSCWTYYSESIDRIYWIGSAAEHPVRARVEDHLRSRPELAAIGSADLPESAAVPAAFNTPRTMLVRVGAEDDLGRCPGTHGHLCCNYLTLNIYVGCTLGCTYCIMQSYLRSRTLEVRLPPVDTAERIRAVAEANPTRTVRLGTGEVGDSLLYDPLFGLSSDLITALSDVPNLRFELKTKTDYVDHLPTHGVPVRNTVVAFSLNPDSVVTAEEGAAASLDRRLAAAQRAVERGYHVAFHFDPMVRIDRWREEYGAVADQLGRFRASPPQWISLGTLRYPATLRAYIEARPYGLDEFVSSGDGKMRYLQKERSAMYRMMRARLAAVLPDTPVYLCMESSAMWRHLQKAVPDRSGGLSRIMRPLDLSVLQEVSR
ncbi:MAG: radical SAM protein [Alkalispirochaeta sp.]